MNCQNKKIINIGITYKRYIKIQKNKSLYGAFYLRENSKLSGEYYI